MNEISPEAVEAAAIRADERAKHGERIAQAIEAERVELEKRLSGVPSWTHISGSFDAAKRIARTTEATA